MVVNTTGADYVFDSSYKLPALGDVEKFIRQHHHLPQIASAADMQTNGVDLGDNQTRLLQKTEELTLYAIEQDKKINEQNARITQLEQQVEILQQLISQHPKKNKNRQ